jgi:hypothetical protein
MSLIVCKYLQNYGFVGFKNDDKNYLPNIKIAKSNRESLERLLIWDDISKYTEGINEHGVCVINCPKVEKEEYKNIKTIHAVGKRYYSPAGFVIRKALTKQNCYEAAEVILQSGVDGTTLVFDAFCCLIITMDLLDSKKHSIKEIKTYDEAYVVANNSENRSRKCLNKLQYVTTPHEIMDICSSSDENDDDSVLLRKTGNFSKNTYKTVAQTMIVPSEKTLYYRPLSGKTVYDMEMINNRESKTFFELVSTKKLLTLMDK